MFAKLVEELNEKKLVVLLGRVDENLALTALKRLGARNLDKETEQLLLDLYEYGTEEMQAQVRRSATIVGMAYMRERYLEDQKARKWYKEMNEKYKAYRERMNSSEEGEEEEEEEEEAAEKPDRRGYDVFQQLYSLQIGGYMGGGRSHTPEEGAPEELLKLGAIELYCRGSKLWEFCDVSGVPPILLANFYAFNGLEPAQGYGYDELEERVQDEEQKEAIRKWKRYATEEDFPDPQTDAGKYKTLLSHGTGNLWYGPTIPVEPGFGWASAHWHLFRMLGNTGSYTLKLYLRSGRGKSSAASCIVTASPMNFREFLLKLFEARQLARAQGHSVDNYRDDWDGESLMHWFCFDIPENGNSHVMFTETVGYFLMNKNWHKSPVRGYQFSEFLTPQLMAKNFLNNTPKKVRTLEQQKAALRMLVEHDEDEFNRLKALLPQ